MAKRKETVDDPFAGGQPSGFEAAAVAEGPAEVEQHHNGEQPQPESPEPKKRRRRDPNAQRPWYQIQGVDRYSGAVRIVLGADTIGQARKKLGDAVQASGGTIDGVRIVRCKAVD